jgi:hypothetical protein
MLANNFWLLFELEFSKFLTNIQNLECLKYHAIHKDLTVRHQQGSLPIQNKGPSIIVFLLREQLKKTKTNIINTFYVKKWESSKLLLRKSHGNIKNLTLIQESPLYYANQLSII